MKKLVIIFVCFVSINVYALETETFITGAYSYCLFTEKADEGTTKIFSNAIDLSISSYFNQSNLGFYLNTEYIFPDVLSATINGNTISTTSDDYDLASIISAIVGITYKYNSGLFNIFGAAGLSLTQTGLANEYMALINYSLGLGGDIGIRLIPTKYMYFTLGSVFSYDFYYNGSLTTAYDEINKSGKYNFTSIRPYIGIGFRLKEEMK